MFKRDRQLYIEDILDAAQAIKEYTRDLDFESFIADRKTYSATIREYTIIGEAIASLIKYLEEEIPDYPWQAVKDFRNFIEHEYFGVDAMVVWDLTIQDLDELVSRIRKLDIRSIED
jgi:uncharacterized protein with HEPN domain